MSRNVFFYLLFTCFLLSGSPLIAAKSRAHITGGYGAIAWHPPSGSYGYAVDRALALLLREKGSFFGLRHEASAVRAARQYHVFVFDRPGYGHSTRPSGRLYTPDEQARLFLQALTLLGVHRPVVLAHSWATLVAVAMAEQAGIEADCIPQALTGGHADGVLFQLLYPRMRQRDFGPRGYARQLLKDLDMVQELAADLKLPTPMTAQAQSLFRMLIQQGQSELDTSAIFKLYER